MIKNSIYFFLILSIVFLFNSCRTIRELKAFAKCDFRIKEISQLNLGGINLNKINKLSDLGSADAAKVGLAFAQGSLPLDLRFDIEVRNPNDKLAALEKLDWILEVDKSDFLDGTTSQRIEVAPDGGTSTLPISTRFDVKDILSKESLSSVINIIAAIKGDNQEDSRIRLKIKPRFKIAGATLGYPGYIKLTKEFKNSEESQ